MATEQELDNGIEDMMNWEVGSANDNTPEDWDEANGEYVNKVGAVTEEDLKPKGRHFEWWVCNGAVCGMQCSAVHCNLCSIVCIIQ